MRRKPSRVLLAAALSFAASAALGLSACAFSPSSASAGPGGAGARAGGAQDIALARSKVAAGEVPTPQDFPPEGLFAEHDLPLEGSPCADVFCVRVGTALAPDAEAGPDGGVAEASWVQLGMASNIDLSTFHRRPLNAAIVIDNSGSMSGGKLEAVKAAAEVLVDKLGEGDLLTVVRFDGSSEVLVGPLPVTNREQFKARIRTLSAGGSTCIECGLRDGFDRIARNASADRDGRLFLFTDALPNVGATGESEFMRLLTANAEWGVGVTAFGVGLDFGQQLVTEMTSAKGANYFYLDTLERTRTIFDTDFDLMVTPVAYDLQLELEPAPGVTLASVYGVPGENVTTLKSTVKTVFLSRTRGALVARLAAVAPGAAIATAKLTFTTAAGEAREATLSAVAPAGAAPSYSGPGARKTVALTRFVVAARKACERFGAGDVGDAKAVAQNAAAELAAEATALGDTELQKEADFARKLADLIAAK